MLGPVFDAFLSHYRYDFVLPSPLLGQDTKADFTFDYRNTYDPYIGDGFINLYFQGELYYKGEGCAHFKPDSMKYYTDQKMKKEFSQVAVSAASASCIANQMAKSEIGTVVLNAESISALFNHPDLKSEFSSTSIAKHMPLFKDKVGAKVPLKMTLNFKDINILFA